jgi:hypothetical protein
MDVIAQRAFASKLSKWSIDRRIKHRTALADALGVPPRRIHAWFKGVMPGKFYLEHLAEIDPAFRDFRGRGVKRAVNEPVPC